MRFRGGGWQQTGSEDTKRCLTWVGSKPYREDAAKREVEREARLERMRAAAHASSSTSGAMVHEMTKTTETPKNMEALLQRLVSSMDPMKDPAIQRTGC